MPSAIAETRGTSQRKRLSSRCGQVGVLPAALSCHTCRKFHQRFRNRSDIAILAFNMDDDPRAMTTALQGVESLDSIHRGPRFCLSIVPEMALPANWVITSGKTEMSLGDDNSHEAWLESTASAIEKAAGK